MDLTLPINIENPDPRVACVVLADVSGSMSGAPIAALEEGFAAFVKYVNNEGMARKRAEVGVVTFGSHAEVALPMREARDLEKIRFDASGSTDMAGAINIGLDMIEERKRQYKESGIQYYRPWLLLLTDGQPNTDGFDAAVTRLNQVEAAKGVTVFAIGVGASVNFDQLKRVSPTRAPAPLKGLEFDKFFEWLSSSLNGMSTSNNFGESDAKVESASQDQVPLASLDGWVSIR